MIIHASAPYLEQPGLPGLLTVSAERVDVSSDLQPDILKNIFQQLRFLQIGRQQPPDETTRLGSQKPKHPCPSPSALAPCRGEMALDWLRARPPPPPRGLSAAPVPSPVPDG